MASKGGFHSFVFKKDVQAIRRHSDDAADQLERIYSTYGSLAGYSAAQAIKKVMQAAASIGGAASSNWQAEMKECPQALTDTRRAVETFMYDYGVMDSRSMRD